MGHSPQYSERADAGSWSRWISSSPSRSCWYGFQLPFLPAVHVQLKQHTVKPVLSGHRIKRTPSIKRTVAEVLKFISLIYFK